MRKSQATSTWNFGCTRTVHFRNKTITMVTGLLRGVSWPRLFCQYNMLELKTSIVRKQMKETWIFFQVQSFTITNNTKFFIAFSDWYLYLKFIVIDRSALRVLRNYFLRIEWTIWRPKRSSFFKSQPEQRRRETVSVNLRRSLLLMRKVLLLRAEPYSQHPFLLYYLSTIHHNSR